MRGPTNRLLYHMGAAVLLLLGMATLASGHAGDNDPTHIHACVGNTSRIVRDVGVNGTCIANPPQLAETAKHWNITGPAGAQGPQGPAGPVNAYIANSNSHVIEGDWQELIGLSGIPGGYYMVWTVIYAHNDNDEFPVVCNLFINNDPVSDPNGADSGLPLTVFSTGADGYGVIATVKPHYLPSASNVIRVFCAGGKPGTILDGDMAALKVP